MNGIKPLLTILIACFIFVAAHRAPDVAPSPIEEFGGSTPCATPVITVLGIPTDETCEFMKWDVKLTPNSRIAGVFSLTVNYGKSKPNTMGFENGGKVVQLEGIYKIEPGTTTFGKTRIFSLTINNSNRFLQLLRINDNLFHVLDSDKHLLVGNGGYSFMLNRRGAGAAK